MAGIIVGSVGVSITPDARGFGDKLKAALQPVADAIGRQVGQTLGDRIADQMPKAGVSAGSRFSDTFKAKVDAALAKLPDATVNLNDDKAQAKLEELRMRLAALSASVGVEIDPTEALTAMRVIRTELDALGARSPKIDVRVDIARASAELGVLSAEVDKVAGKGGGDGGFAGLASSIDGSAGSISALIPLGITLGAVLAPIVAVLTGGVLAVAGAFGAAAVGAAAFALVALPVIKNIKAGVGPAGEALLALKNGFHELSVALQPQILALVTSALQLAVTFLPVVAEFAQAAAKGFSDLLASSGPLVGQIKSIASGFAALSGPAIVAIGQMFGALAVAAGKLLLAFTPLGLQIIPKITAALQRFAAGDSISRFLAYVTANAPAVLAFLSAMARDIGALVVAFAPLGLAIIKVTTPLLAFIAAHTEIALGIVAAAITGVAVALIVLTESNPIGLLATGIILGLALLIANWDTVKRFVETWGPQLLVALVPMIGIPLVIYQHFSQIRGFLSSAFSSALGAVQAGVNAVVSFVASLPGRILDAIGYLGNLLWNVGAQLVDGLWNGFKNAFGGFLHDAHNLLSKIPGIPGSPTFLQIAPAVLQPVGALMAKGLGTGFASAIPGVVSGMHAQSLGFGGAPLMPYGSSLAGLSVPTLTLDAGSVQGGASVQTRLVIEGNVYGDQALISSVQRLMDQRDEQFDRRLVMG